MNFRESIKSLSDINSFTCYPKTYDNIDKDLPYFKIDSNKNIDMFNYKTHDNAPRMPYICSYILYNIIPYVKGDLTGYYNIQLHDTYTYLNDDKNYKDVLCFGKFKDEKGPVCLPDCYFLGDWNGKYNDFKDKLSWQNKKDKICFYGTTTGNRNPLLNERIQTCLWAIDKPECDFYITNIAQIDQKVLIKTIPDFFKIYTKRVSMIEQLKYKYHLLIDGNTKKWDVDTYFTNSLAFSMPSKDMLWYSSLLCDKREFVEVDKDSMINTYLYYQNNPKEVELITSNAQRIAKELFKSSIAREYMIDLFENIASNK